LLPATLLLAGCGLLPTTFSPTQPAATPAGQPARPAAGAPTAAGGPQTGPAGNAPGPTAPPPTPSPSPSPTPVPKTTVKVGTSKSLGGWIIDVADKQGFFSGQNIVLDRKETDPGSMAAAEDLDKKDRDIGVVATDRLIQGGKNGQALVMIAGLVNKAVHALIGARDVDDINAVKGKPIGYWDEKSASAAILKRMMKAKGITESQSRIISFADPGVVGAAVANGTVGASLVDAARGARLRGNGFNVLMEADEVAKEYQAEGLVVRPDWARQNEDLLARFIRATIQAERWVTTPANKDAAIKQLADSLGVSESEAATVYEADVEKLGAIARDGEIDQAGVRAVVDLLAEVDAAGDPRPDPVKLTDTTLLQRVRPGGGSVVPITASPSGSPSTGGAPSPGASPTAPRPASPSPSPAPR
jgi:ABC-type nitrate/sulfonate/bicarbonate transport system substrate-binding protein